MPRPQAGVGFLAGKSGVRVVVIGDPGTGKSSLVVALATEQFTENVPKVMPPIRLPADYFSDRVPINIIDTSSSPEEKRKFTAECQVVDGRCCSCTPGSPISGDSRLQWSW
ncbi:unnamed protein product [Urochloa humidicola]